MPPLNFILVCMNKPKKSLGQHWLHDQGTLQAIVEAGKIKPNDFVLEIGPGLGTLTAELLKTGAKVHALEYDQSLIPELQAKFGDSPDFKLEQGDILKFDYGKLPADYKIVANIPYYLTAHLFRVLSEPATPKPIQAVLLVQKEVAERTCSAPGQMSIVSVAMQLVYETSVGPVVPPHLFTPPPKVDSQVLILTRRPNALFPDFDHKIFMRTVKAGFSGKRKTLRNSLAAGLHLDKRTAEQLLRRAGIDPSQRAQSLSLDDWHRLYVCYTES